MTTYQDIDISLGIHPSTKDVLKLYDVSACKFALKNLLLTTPGEHPDDPAFGCGISNLLFELSNPILQSLIQRKINEQVSFYLPEISLQNVTVNINPDTGELVIIITYFAIGNTVLQTFNLVLERNR